MNEHEKGFAQSFVTPGKRHRYLTLLSTVKGRMKLIRNLDHFGDLDCRFAQEVPSKWTRSDLLSALLASKAPAIAYIMSADSELDGRVLPLADAVQMVFGSATGTFISCIPGQLGFLETEEVGCRYSLKRDHLGA